MLSRCDVFAAALCPGKGGGGTSKAVGVGVGGRTIQLPKDIQLHRVAVLAA